MRLFAAHDAGVPPPFTAHQRYRITGQRALAAHCAPVAFRSSIATPAARTAASPANLSDRLFEE
jgi:hypothetical protein